MLLEMPRRGKLTILRPGLELQSKPVPNYSDSDLDAANLFEREAGASAPQKLLLKKVGAKLGHNTCNFVRALKK